MSNIFFISDLHLGHRNIITFTGADGKPLRAFSSIEEHDDYVIESINKVVNPKDRLILVGDCVINKSQMFKVGRLNGRKTLVMGNHDPRAFEYLTPYFEQIAGAMEISNFIVTHIPVHPAQLVHRFVGNIHGHLHHHHVHLHAQVDEGKFNPRDSRYFNVSVEAVNYKPISLEEIKACFLSPESYLGI